MEFKSNNMIRLSKSIIGEQETKAVKEVIENIGYLGMGTEVQKFELEIEGYLGLVNRKCVCVNSGTAALHLAIESITKPGDEVLLPSLTYVATYQAVVAAGCIPVSCEVDPETLTIDINDAEKRMSPRTKAIITVHIASNPGYLSSLYNFANNNGLRVIEDAAQAFGCVYKGTKVGAQGDIVCFSFDGIKNITSGEGGAIITEDMNVLEKVKDARLLGVSKDTEKRYAGSRSWDFDVTSKGYRYHMSNIFAAIGRVQLKRLDNEFGPKRKMLKQEYIDLLALNSNIILQKSIDEADIIPHIFILRILGGKRDAIFKVLTEQGIQVGIHYKPNHLLSLFKSSYNLPITEQIYSEIITLPLHPQVSLDQVNLICTIINQNL